MSLILNMLLLALFVLVVDQVVLTALVVMVNCDDIVVACYGCDVKEIRKMQHNFEKG